MKIQVVRCDGDIETLTLTEPLELRRSKREGGQNYISTATGMEHFFRADGRYDGWGMALGGNGIVVEGMPEGIPNEVSGIIDAIEADREITKASEGRKG